MATYKVIQDIEAEDKILGPLTLKQFICALVTTFFLYLCFIAITKHAAYLLVILLPPALLAGFFTFPFGKDQPTEVWAVAKIGFLFKPRRRIWDQSGVKELVTVTVPKKIERIYTNGLSQTEVKSRLSALANTIDSRGWAIKNVNVNLYAQAGLVGADTSDRLVAMSSIPQPVADYDIKASDDMLDEHSNPIAQQFTQMISASSQAHRQQLMDTMNQAAPTQSTQTTPVPAGVDMWFTPQPLAPPSPSSIPFTPQVLEPATVASPAAPVSVTPTAEELAVLDHIKAGNSVKQVYSSHMKTIQPLSTAQPPAEPAAHLNAPGPIDLQPAVVPEPAITPKANPVIQNLARSNDLNISTLAREAQKAKPQDDPMQGEVVISLR